VGIFENINVTNQESDAVAKHLFQVLSGLLGGLTKRASCNEKISVPYTEKISEKMKIFQLDRHNHFIFTIGIAVD
jgi:hypothetical protein